MIKKYKIIKIPKGNGKFRTIYAPDKKYKKALKKANKKISRMIFKYDKTETIHGFVPKRSCITNAEKHINYEYTLSMDLENFFESVTDTMLTDYLKDEFLNLCFIDGIARQGLPTSPTLSNLAFLKADEEIKMSLSHLIFLNSYTRYADDLTISFNDISCVSSIISTITTIVEKHGFKVNESKTKLQKASNGRRIITGVGVDDKVYPTRKILKKIRAAKHQENEDSLLGLEEWAKCKKPKRK